MPRLFFFPIAALLCANAALAAGTQSISASALAPVPHVRVHWVGTDGVVTTEPDEGLQTQWVWDDDQAESPRLEKGGPALRITVNTTRVPRTWRLVRSLGDDGSVVNISDPSPRKSVKQRKVVFDQLAVVSGYDLEFDTGGGHREHLSAAISVPKTTPALLTRPKSCPDRSVKLLPKEIERGTYRAADQPPPGHHLFIGIYCYEDYWNTYFYLVRSRDARWAYSGMPSENQPRALLYKIENSSDNESYSGEPIKVRTRDSDAGVTEAVVQYSASKESSD